MPYNSDVHLAPLHRSFGLLAAIAMLLIVLAPLVSRWIAHGDPAAPAEVVHAPPALTAPPPQSHHGSHLQHGDGHAADARLSAAEPVEPVEQHMHRAHPAQQTQHTHEAHEAHETQTTQPPHEAHDHGGAAGKDPHAGHDMGVDCDYCLIAARMISLLVAMLLALIGWQAPYFARTSALPWRTGIAVGHLGARGPPQHA